MRSILIVEDDPLVRKTLASQLAKKGFEVSVAETGEDGVRMYGESATDIVLLDVRLPDIDGLEVLRRIRERSRRAVILVMTAFGALMLGLAWICRAESILKLPLVTTDSPSVSPSLTM